MIQPTKFLLPLCLLLVFTIACKNEKKEEAPANTKTDTSTTAPADATPPPTSEEIKLPYPALGNKYISELYAQTKKVDIIFYDLPISVNQDDEGNAKSTVLYVSPTNPIVTADCKPIGRLTWIGDGVIIKEADIYLDTGCAYVMFMDGDVGSAVNALSESGVQFFQRIISEVEKRNN